MLLIEMYVRTLNYGLDSKQELNVDRSTFTVLAFELEQKNFLCFEPIANFFCLIEEVFDMLWAFPKLPTLKIKFNNVLGHLFQKFNFILKHAVLLKFQIITLSKFFVGISTFKNWKFLHVLVFKLRLLNFTQFLWPIFDFFENKTDFRTPK